MHVNMYTKIYTKYSTYTIDENLYANKNKTKQGL